MLPCQSACPDASFILHPHSQAPYKFPFVCLMFLFQWTCGLHSWAMLIICRHPTNQVRGLGKAEGPSRDSRRAWPTSVSRGPSILSVFVVCFAARLIQMLAGQQTWVPSMNLHYRMSYLSSVFIVTCPWKSIWEVALSKAGANITCPASKELIFCSSGVSFAVLQALPDHGRPHTH